MKYFKRNGVVIKSDHAPIVPPTEGLQAIVNGTLVPLSSVSDDIEVQGVLVETSNFWEQATELEYLMYCSRKLNILSYADRDTQAKIWALNNATKTELRLGSSFPDDKLSIPITSREQKVEIIALTQHWQADDLPSVTRDNNSTWVNWIIGKRINNPFVYLGSVIDVSTED